MNGFDVSRYLTVKEARRVDPFVHYAVAAAKMALDDANLMMGGEVSSAIIVGSSRGGISTMSAALERFFYKKTSKLEHNFSAYLMPSTTVSMAASYIAQRFNIKGEVAGLSTACASGAVAIGEAFRLIKYGVADVVIAGGAEAPLTLVCLEGYDCMGALSRKDKSTLASVPFDLQRDGFVLAEGACILVIEELQRAICNNRHIYAEIIGYCNYTGGVEQVKPDIDSAVYAIKCALTSAGVSSKDVDFINAHGTSTIIGDEVEAQALGVVFGNRLLALPLTANKSVTGHMLAASAAFEIAVTAMSLKLGLIPPTANTTHVQPQWGLRVLDKPLDGDFKIAIKTAFGFGGINSVVVLKRYDTFI